MTHNIKKPSLDKKPDRFLFIIGAMKSGTTSLFDILGQHPEICQAQKKEPSYFVSDRDKKSLKNYLGLWRWNRALHKYAMEASVSYTQFPFIKGVPERMARAELGEYRFIYLMRNPLARIESQVRHRLFAGWGKSLDEGIQDDLIDFSRYAMQMDEYLKFFSKDQILLVVLEEFKKDPCQVLERICGFLEIDKHYRFSNIEEPRNSGEFFGTSPVIRKLLQSRLGKQMVQRFLPFQFKNWLRKKVAGLGNKSAKKPGLGRWKLSANEKKEIAKKLSPDMKRLQSEYAIDISAYWLKPSEYPVKSLIN